MKLFKKSTISLALTAALVGGAVVSQQASALPVLNNGGAPYVSATGLGQALIFPYYSTKNGMKSFFNITNTSNDTLAVKVRFRENLNSRDALDFNLVMSPQDVWTGWVEDNGAGIPVVRTVDNTCAIGVVSGSNDMRTNGIPLSSVAYGNINGTTGVFADAGDNTIARTREGYVEVIAMGKATAGTTAADALHKPANAAGDRLPANCARIITRFNATQSSAYPVALTPAQMQGTAGDGDPSIEADFTALKTGENPLKGNFSINNDGSAGLGMAGIGAGNTAVAIADFANPALAALGAGNSLVTAQKFPYFLEPTLASRDGLWSTTGLAAVEESLMSDRVVNEWANVAATSPGTGTGAQTDWVMTFPTKSFHVDNLNATGGATVTNIQAAVNQWRLGSAALVGTRTGSGLTGGIFGLATAANSYNAPITVSLTAYDREEGAATVTTTGVTPSPSPVFSTPFISLNREANVIQFNGLSALGSSIATNINNPVNATTHTGWINLTFGDATAAGTMPAVGDALPVVGYVYKMRNQGSDDLNFGQIMDHALIGDSQ